MCIILSAVEGVVAPATDSVLSTVIAILVNDTSATVAPVVVVMTVMIVMIVVTGA